MSLSDGVGVVGFNSRPSFHRVVFVLKAEFLSSVILLRTTTGLVIMTLSRLKWSLLSSTLSTV